MDVRDDPGISNLRRTVTARRYLATGASFAVIAQLVEHRLAKAENAGSSPAARSILERWPRGRRRRTRNAVGSDASWVQIPPSPPTPP